MCARKELIQFCPQDFFALDAFLSTGNIVGVVIYMGKNMGSQFAKFEITALGVPTLKNKNNTPKW